MSGKHGNGGGLNTGPNRTVDGGDDGLNKGLNAPVLGIEAIDGDNFSDQVLEADESDPDESNPV